MAGKFKLSIKCYLKRYIFFAWVMRASGNSEFTFIVFMIGNDFIEIFLFAPVILEFAIPQKF